MREDGTWYNGVQQITQETWGYTVGSVSRFVTAGRTAALSQTENSAYDLSSGAVLRPHASTPKPLEKEDSSTPSEGLSSCSQCEVGLGWTKFKYECGHCRKPFCNEHLPFRDYVHTQTGAELERVCDECHVFLQEEAHKKRVAWRLARVEAFFSCTLIPMTEEREDNTKKKALRALALSVKAAKVLPIGWTTNAVAAVVDFILTHGSVTFDALMMSTELTEAVSSIFRAAGSPDNIDLKDVVRGLYYTLARHRWERGAKPVAQEEEHHGATRVPIDEISVLLYYSTFALQFVYLTEPMDLQRLLALQGYALIAAEMKSESPEVPAYFLSASRERKEVIVSIRGTASVNDFGTDVSAIPIPFPPNQKKTLAHGGIARAAIYLINELRICLEEFAHRGYKITLTGHSLGAACATLLGIVLHNFIPAVAVYGFGCPSCVCDELVGDQYEFVVNLVNCDDVVPRLNVPRSRKLLQELVDYKSSWKTMFDEDSSSTTTRVKNVWNPNYRDESLDIIEKVGYTRHVPKKSLVSANGAIIDEEEKEEEKETPPEKKTGVQWIRDAFSVCEMEEVIMEPVESLKELETPAIPLYVPGRIYHIMLSSRSQKVMLEIDPKHTTLDSIQVYENMIDDHLGDSYQCALEECIAAYRAPVVPPPKCPFDASDSCQICCMDFTWNSTWHSAGQQSMDRKNCRQCGRLVCPACSKNKRPLPSLGHPYPVRVCDLCFFNPCIIAGLDH